MDLSGFIGFGPKRSKMVLKNLVLFLSICNGTPNLKSWSMCMWWPGMAKGEIVEITIL